MSANHDVTNESKRVESQNTLISLEENNNEGNTQETKIIDDNTTSANRSMREDSKIYQSVFKKDDTIQEETTEAIDEVVKSQGSESDVIDKILKKKKIKKKKKWMTQL